MKTRAQKKHLKELKRKQKRKQIYKENIGRKKEQQLTFSHPAYRASKLGSPTLKLHVKLWKSVEKGLKEAIKNGKKEDKK